MISGEFVELQFRTLVESVEDYAIFLLDSRGRVASWNIGAARIKGYEAREILGRPFEIFYPASDRARAKFLLGCAEREGRVRDEGWLVRKDGGRFWADVTLTALRNEAGELTGYAKVTHDITERKRAFDSIRRQAEALRLSNEELEQFAVVASHDLQAPLRKINAFGEVLEERLAGSLPADAADALARMRRAAASMTEMIQDLLDLARVGREERIEDRVALGPIAEGVVADLQPVLRDAQVEIGTLPSVRGDRVQLRQLLQNLIDNALKFRGGAQRHRVLVKAVYEPEAGMCAFEVSDNGIGFENREFDRMRRPFERLNPTGAFEGAGMGLALCHKIAARHGGALDARGAPGAGSVFRVKLPRARRNL